MTRGPWQTKTLELAEEIALRCGAVYRCNAGRYDAFEIIIYEEWRNVFVKVRRSRSYIVHPFDILLEYRTDLIRLNRIPLTNITAREFWVRLPHGRWQFFLLTHDSVVEIQANGLHIPRMVLPVPVTDLRREEPSPEPESSDSPTEEGE